MKPAINNLQPNYNMKEEEEEEGQTIEANFENFAQELLPQVAVCSLFVCKGGLHLSEKRKR